MVMDLTDLCNMADQQEMLQKYLNDHGKIVIKIEGEGWNGTVNYRVALFIVKLQEALAKTCQVKGASYADLEIEAEISKGCSNIVINLCNILKNVVDKMSGNQIAAILGVTLVGFFIERGFIENKQLDNQLKTNVHIEDTRLEQIKNANSTINTAMHILGNSINGSDKISVNNTTFSKNDFLEKYKDDGKSKEEDTGRRVYAVDGLYAFDSISTEKRSVSVKLDNKYRQATAVALSDDEMKALLNKQSESVGKEQSSRENFRIDVELLGGAVKRVKILGLGEPRHDAMTLDNAKQNSIDIEEHE